MRDQPLAAVRSRSCTSNWPGAADNPRRRVVHLLLDARPTVQMPDTGSAFLTGPIRAGRGPGPLYRTDARSSPCRVLLVLSSARGGEGEGGRGGKGKKPPQRCIYATSQLAVCRQESCFVFCSLVGHDCGGLLASEWRVAERDGQRAIEAGSTRGHSGRDGRQAWLTFDPRCFDSGKIGWSARARSVGLAATSVLCTACGRHSVPARGLCRATTGRR